MSKVLSFSIPDEWLKGLEKSFGGASPNIAGKRAVEAFLRGGGYLDTPSNPILDANPLRLDAPSNLALDANLDSLRADIEELRERNKSLEARVTALESPERLQSLAAPESQPRRESCTDSEELERIKSILDAVPSGTRFTQRELTEMIGKFSSFLTEIYAGARRLSGTRARVKEAIDARFDREAPTVNRVFFVRKPGAGE
jgi:hypothetical protein